jgi:hypothetical protein
VAMGDEGSMERLIDQPVAMLHDRWGLALGRTLNQV